MNIMIKWEYKAVNLGVTFKTGEGAMKMIQEECNKLGEQGWELVNFQNYDLATKFMLVFKRPKQ